MNKKTLAIFDLTDCEGCEVELFSLRKSADWKIINKYFNIINWRLADEKAENLNFDVALIEGSPASKKEIAFLKKIRAKSKILIAFGACACIGGIPAMIDEHKKEALLAYVYGKNYRSEFISAKPLSHYIAIDYQLSGCPVNPKEVKQILLDIAHDKPLKEKSYSVCFECKARHNDCLFIHGKPCLGPVTKAGCGAICPAKGLRCYGCWGQVADANVLGMIIALKKQGHTKKQIRKIMDIFWKQSDGYEKYLKELIKIKIKLY